MYNALLSALELIRNYPLDLCPTELNWKERLLCKWMPRVEAILPKMRISGSDERVGTRQGGSVEKTNSVF